MQRIAHQEAAMSQVTDLDHILSDCFLAVGQAIGPDKAVDFATITWWHRRYRRTFHYAMTTARVSWVADRRRVTAVGRYLGQRAVHYAGRRAFIDRAAAAQASTEIERGCQMSATQDSVLQG